MKEESATENVPTASRSSSPSQTDPYATAYSPAILNSTSDSSVTAVLPDDVHMNGVATYNIPSSSIHTDGFAAEVLNAAAIEAGREILFSSAQQGREMLVRKWETYIGDGQVEQFQPLQMLSNLRLCGTGADLARITSGSMSTSNQHHTCDHSSDGDNTRGDGATASFKASVNADANAAGDSFAEQDPFDAIMLRHTRSTPLQPRSSIFSCDNSDDCGNAFAAPSPLEMRRSSSTPSAFRQHSANSAFGALLRPMPRLERPDDRSAFSLPVHRPSLAMSDSDVRYSAFDPVSFSATTGLEQADAEDTAIEVQDMSTSRGEPFNDEKKYEAKSKRAGSRTARFFSDVRSLRRKRRGRDGRENPVQPSTKSPTSSPASRDDNKKVSEHDEIMITSSIDDKEKSSKSNVPESMEYNLDNTKVDAMVVDQYHQLDSDADEEFAHYQKIEASIPTGSPARMSSPSCNNMDGRENSTVDPTLPAVLIEVSSSMAVLSPQGERAVNQPGSVSSPNPGMSITAASSIDSRAMSPGTATRSSSATTNTSGHTTQATSTTGHFSGLSSISETDREVMETIKEGKRRRRQQVALDTHKSDTDGTSIHSLSSTSTGTNGYIALTGSPVDLREGANVPADRFFTQSQLSSASLSTRRGAGSNSSTVASSASSMPHTMSTVSMGDEPPTFVSYFDRQYASDLTSVREVTETFQRLRGEDLEEREDSPAENVGSSAFMLEEDKTTSFDSTASHSQHQHQPKPNLPVKDRLRGRFDKFRSRPPLSPIKGSRTPTTPPPGMVSPSYHQLSPPRNIVDHRIGSNVPRPYVVRTNPLGPKIVLVSPQTGAVVSNSVPFGVAGGYAGYNPQHNFTDSVADNNYHHHSSFNTRVDAQGSFNINRNRTYEERNIEIMKTDSKDDMTSPRFISPEKDTGSS